MRDSAVYQQILQEGRLELLLYFLDRKFGPLPVELVQRLNAITNGERLLSLADAAIDALDLQSFRAQV
ncbi:DUF4351 domain-containing protein [Gloeobacter morelensis]|uniref:DUF4351 domain-containing protein n=1 Tax=Gloeobacter morelensis MG652769 TaxID=2781736 RepID=A0ABY3PIW4_9CYAN|nr:DUF4351 domain-containing protein [Gloeobacter morelensis]UFP93613.1 DUF4351 domain-containing protein [Gloeobacter morelensis MG652769]